jgi:hypothetical protein
MEKIQDFVLKGKEVYVGLEDSKKSWRVCVRSGRLVAHETTMPAEYENLRNYFRNKFPRQWKCPNRCGLLLIVCSWS